MSKPPIDIQLLVSIISLVCNIIMSIFVGILTYLTLVFTAKPKIKVSFNGEAKTGRTSFSPSEKVSFMFSIKNVGRFYAKPAAMNTILYLNFDKSFELFSAHKGANLEIREKQVYRGKSDSKYIKVQRINLFYGDAENVVIETQLPNKVGTYPIWISAYSTEASHGIFHFKIDVKSS